MILPGTAGAAEAQEAQRRYAIPARDPSSALEAFGRQSGKSVMFDRTRMAGARSKGVSGRVSAEAALDRILQDTGFAARAANSNTFVIEVKQVDGRRGDASALPSSAMASQDTGQSEAATPEILVTANRGWSLNTDIRRTRDNAQPYIIFDSEHIKRSGATSIEQFFRDKSRDTETGVDYWSAEAILRHPDFPKARRAYFKHVLALYGDDVFLNKLLMEAVRIVIFAVAICLHAGYRAEERESWPTIGNLKKALALFGLASPRRIEQVVARLIQTGFLESRPALTDGRARLLMPTEKMVEHDQQWLVAHYAPLAALFGPEDDQLALMGDRQFQQVQRRIAIGFFARSAAVMLRNPDILQFLARDAGIFILIDLADQADGGGNEVELSFSHLAGRYGVSRTHVRQLMAAAAARSLVSLDGGNRRVKLSGPLLASLDRFIAEGMSNHDLTARLAYAEMTQTSACGRFGTG